MNNNPPAFPTQPKNHGYENAEGTGAQEGMTLRDYFAAKILSGVVANPTFNPSTTCDKHIARACYDLAEAMIQESELR